MFQMVHTQGSGLHTGLHATRVTELIRVDLWTQTVTCSSFADQQGFFGGEISAVAEYIHEVGQVLFGDARQHVAAQQIDIALTVILVFGWNGVGAEEGSPHGYREAGCQSAYHPQHAQF